MSTDPVKTLAHFREKHGFPFRFLSDPEHRVHDEYGTWVEKTRMGKTYMGTARTTFVIGPDGILRHIFENVTPQGHAQEVLDVLPKG